MKKEEIEEIRAHNGAMIKINTSDKVCEKYSGFKRAKQGSLIRKSKNFLRAALQAIY